MLKVLTLFLVTPFVLLASNKSNPIASETINSIPEVKDVTYPSTLELSVDVTDIRHRIFKVTEVIPHAPSGPLTLLYPQWLPGNHSPAGTISKLAGLKVSVKNEPLLWKRDPLNVFAFHIQVPAGNPDLKLEFDFLTPTESNQGRIVATEAMLNLQWNSVVLYPSGYYARNVFVKSSVTIPADWKIYTALEVDSIHGATTYYKKQPLDILIDSPAFAGANSKLVPLSKDVSLAIVADKPRDLVISKEALEAHKNLITQAVALFGSQHYDHYTFLLALSDHQGSIGLEHHRSSENGTSSQYFSSWKTQLSSHELLTHEYAHSWNGKFRRPEDLWTPNYNTPMQDSLLWVYEGQTQFWGWVLAARSGMISHQDALDALAQVAAIYEERKGRLWRPLIDTTNDPIIAQRAPQAWTSFQRAEDYYSEGLLIWLDVDSLLRQLSHNRKSLDDFAKLFFGIKDRDFGEVTYSRQTIIELLNKIQPYDWNDFFHKRVDLITEHAPLDGLTRGGYKLVYTNTQTEYAKSSEIRYKGTNLTYSLGLVLSKDGAITGVAWDSPAFNAGLSVGSSIVAVNSRAFDTLELKEVIASKKSPIELLVRTGDIYRNVEIQYTDGLRYPRLEKLDSKATSLDDLLSPKN